MVKENTTRHQLSRRKVIVGLILSYYCVSGKPNETNQGRSTERGKRSRQKLSVDYQQRHIVEETSNINAGTGTSETPLVADIFDPVYYHKEWFIEGSVLSEAKCSECRADLEAEQSTILSTLYQEYGRSHVILIYREMFLANAQYIKVSTSKSLESTKKFIRQIPGVQEVGLSRLLELQQKGDEHQALTTTTMTTTHNVQQWPTTFDIASDYVGAVAAREEFCTTGKGIRVAVLDTGIDYTHSLLGGPGTLDAYVLAYGENASSETNKQPSIYFPTSKVVGGYDFVGEAASPGVMGIRMDANPIDAPGGHGTRVASCILAVVPDVELLAVKVCSLGGCPEHSVLAGISYAVQNGAHIINLSMGSPYVSSYNSVLTKAAEQAHESGVIITVSAGNHGNIPFVVGDLASMNNAITVGATDTFANKGYMADFSSRGVGDGVRLKPDLSAPGGTIIAAAAGSGMGVMETYGTSFSSPFATGGAAMILERCPQCSPFAIKSIMMNNVDRNIRYTKEGDIAAPLSWAGSGALQVRKSLSAGIWAYSLTDVQPSISLGMINAFEDTRFSRTIRITKLVEGNIKVRIQPQYRHESMVAVLQIDPDLVSFIWSKPIGDTRDVEINFDVVAAKAPTSHLTSSGRDGNNPSSLDIHEFDGWIVIEYEPARNNSETGRKDISVPFYSVIRQASDLVSGSQPIWPAFGKGTTTDILEVDFINNGVGTAQIDSFELLYMSLDDPEAEAGTDRPSADLNYVGFRSLPGDQENCDFVLEFAFHLWEKHKRLAETQLQVHFDLDRDGTVDYILANRGRDHHHAEFSDCRIRRADSWEWSCTGFVPDHGVDTATTIVRACSNDLNIGKSKQIIDVSFVSFGNSDEENESDASPSIQLQVPTPTLSAPSYDVPGGSMLTELQVQTDNDLVYHDSASGPLGLLLITNAWRSRDRTGAATPRSEVIVLPIGNLTVPKEVTPDVLNFPQATKLSGPTLSSWYAQPETCGYVRRRVQELADNNLLLVNDTGWQNPQMPQRKLQECPENDVPRSSVRIPRLGITTSEIDKVTPEPSSNKEESSDSGTSIPAPPPAPMANITTSAPPTSYGASLEHSVESIAASPYPLVPLHNTTYVKKKAGVRSSHMLPSFPSSSSAARTSQIMVQLFAAFSVVSLFWVR